ncbi:hypothetical protein HK099_007606 [Clydaea vesicula]|uniref:Uncharacterized protein n=1 Tax=Clydaea vesicula TaxID=447962 RepID=A0AAD5XYD9_9FUNG|nr:hypothetical protein HK099_007606 [Clydaea vesicula]
MTEDAQSNHNCNVSANQSVATSISNSNRYMSLMLSITEPKDDFSPGYEGDERLVWEVQTISNYKSALKRTNLALLTLREFWDCKKEMKKHSHIQPVGVDFINFYRFICLDILSFSDSESESSVIIHSLPLEPITDEELSKLAKELIKSEDVMHYFLADLRDWDAFRLLMRRHNAALCVVPIEDDFDEQLESESKDDNLNNTEGNEFVIKDSGDIQLPTHQVDLVKRSKRFTERNLSEKKDVKKKLIFPRVFLKSNAEAILESKIESLEKIHLEKEKRWKQEKLELIREFEQLKDELYFKMSALKNSGTKAPSSDFVKSEEETIVKSILKKPSSENINNLDSTTSKKFLQWDDSVISAEVEKERKLRIEQTFISLYGNSGFDEKDVYDFGENFGEGSSDDEVNGVDNISKETEKITTDSPKHKISFDSIAVIPPFKGNFNKDENKQREFGHRRSMEDFSAYKKSAVEDNVVLKRNSEIFEVVKKVDVKSIIGLFEEGKSNSTQKSPIVLASGRRRRAENSSGIIPSVKENAALAPEISDEKVTLPLENEHVSQLEPEIKDDSNADSNISEDNHETEVNKNDALNQQVTDTADSTCELTAITSEAKPVENAEIGLKDAIKEAPLESNEVLENPGVAFDDNIEMGAIQESSDILTETNSKSKLNSVVYPQTEKLYTVSDDEVDTKGERNWKKKIFKILRKHKSESNLKSESLSRVTSNTSPTMKIISRSLTLNSLNKSNKSSGRNDSVIIHEEVNQKENFLDDLNLYSVDTFDNLEKKKKREKRFSAFTVFSNFANDNFYDSSSSTKIEKIVDEKGDNSQKTIKKRFSMGFLNL